MDEHKNSVKTEPLFDLLQTQQGQEVQSSGKKQAQEDKPFSYWLEKNHYYHHRLKKFYRSVIPQGMRVLAVQCKNGYLLDAVKPSYGVGVDTDSAMINEAKETYARHRFYCGTVTDLKESGSFDYILLSSATGGFDVQLLFEALKPFCHPSTRIIIDNDAYSWQPFLQCAQTLQLRKNNDYKNYVTCEDMQNILYVTDFRQISRAHFLLMPVYLPIISSLFNTVLARLPLINRLCMHQAIIARPLFVRRNTDDPVVSVIIFCENKELVEHLVARIPDMGALTELMFIVPEGDQVLEEVKRVMLKYPHRAVSYQVRCSKIKTDALHAVNQVMGDVIITFDADEAIAPEQLLKLYYALIENKAECVRASRRAYGKKATPLGFVRSLCVGLLSRAASAFLLKPVNDPLCSLAVMWKDDLIREKQASFYYKVCDLLRVPQFLVAPMKSNREVLHLPVHAQKNRKHSLIWASYLYYNFIKLFVKNKAK